jgi:hypothetical protein
LVPASCYAILVSYSSLFLLVSLNLGHMMCHEVMRDPAVGCEPRRQDFA